MLLDLLKFAALELAAILIFATSLIAGDPPPTADGVAPPERFSVEQREHWAYQPVKRVEPKAVKESRWVLEPDRSIHPGRARRAGLEAFAAGKPCRIDTTRHVRPDRTAAIDR